MNLLDYTSYYADWGPWFFLIQGFAVALTAIIPPLPAEFMVIGSGTMSAENIVPLRWAFVATFGGCLIGDIGLYTLFRYKLIGLILRWRWGRGLHRRILRVSLRVGGFSTWAGLLLVYAMPFGRSAAMATAGLMAMSWPRLLGLAVTGGFCWTWWLLGLGLVPAKTTDLPAWMSTLLGIAVGTAAGAAIAYLGARGRHGPRRRFGRERPEPTSRRESTRPVLEHAQHLTPTEAIPTYLVPTRKPTTILPAVHIPTIEGESPMSTDQIRVALVGIGNCAASLVQGVEYYKNAHTGDDVPGLMHVRFGDYHIRDIEFVAAFDVDEQKVGTDLSEGIHASENNTIAFADVPHCDVRVQRGPTLDGLGDHYRDTIIESPTEPVDVTAALREAEADVVVCYLPVGSEQAAKFYAQAAIDAGCAFVNALPVFIAGTQEWAEKFSMAGLPIIGDDIKSQVGATIVHRQLARLMEERGVHLDHTYQLNVGGNMDFKNMLQRDRLESKKLSKTQAVTSNTSAPLGTRDVHIGPSDHVPWLDDRKWAYIRLEGRNFGDAPLAIELKLEVWDSPNSAGVIIDAIRAAKIGLDRGMSGPLVAPSAYFMKSPPEQYHDEAAHELVESFIHDAGNP